MCRFASVFLLGAVLAGCGGGSDVSETVERITSDPAAHFGATVSVESEVSRAIDHNVWEMADGEIFVISAKPVRPAPRVGEKITVMGTVRPFDSQTIQQQLGLDIRDEFFDDPDLVDDTAIVADSLKRAQ